MVDKRSGPRTAADLAAGHERELEPLAPVDLSQVTSFSDLLEAMKGTAFGGRQLGEAADILCQMVADPDCFVVGTFSGAMTVAKQGLVLCDMIDHGMLDAVVSTGALMAHGLVEAAGFTHFKAPAEANDRDLYYQGFDRVYDTLELERNLDDVEQIFESVLARWPDGETACSSALCRAIGRWLVLDGRGRAILASAVERDVPVFVPAFTDSELGLDFALFNRGRRTAGQAPISFDPFLDLEQYTACVAEAKTLGLFTIGGGVPRNWAQQVGPYLDVIHRRGRGQGGFQRFRYAIRICPEPVHWGGFSGCTYSEGVSWGKFVPPSEGGRFAEVAADATLVWPLLVAGALERLGGAQRE